MQTDFYKQLTKFINEFLDQNKNDKRDDFVKFIEYKNKKEREING